MILMYDYDLLFASDSFAILGWQLQLQLQWRQSPYRVKAPNPGHFIRNRVVSTLPMTSFMAKSIQIIVPQLVI